MKRINNDKQLLNHLNYHYKKRNNSYIIITQFIRFHNIEYSVYNFIVYFQICIYFNTHMYIFIQMLY